MQNGPGSCDEHVPGPWNIRPKTCLRPKSPGPQRRTARRIRGPRSAFSVPARKGIRGTTKRPKPTGSSRRSVGNASEWPSLAAWPGERDPLRKPEARTVSGHWRRQRGKAESAADPLAWLQGCAAESSCGNLRVCSESLSAGRCGGNKCWSDLGECRSGGERVWSYVPVFRPLPPFHRVIFGKKRLEILEGHAAAVGHNP